MRRDFMMETANVGLLPIPLIYKVGCASETLTSNYDPQAGSFPHKRFAANKLSVCKNLQCQSAVRTFGVDTAFEPRQ